MSTMSLEIPQVEKAPKKGKTYLLPITDELIEILSAPGGKDKINKRALAGMYIGMVDPRAFACAKICERWLVGQGILQRAGQTPIGSVGTINNFFVSIRNEEDAKRLIELGYAAAGLPAGDVDGEIALVQGTNPEPDQGRCALVASVLHEDT